ncbi:unknown [Clostridium sp. CAG:575]|nr:unknown [Clostridium sp. CAG:575]
MEEQYLKKLENSNWKNKNSQYLFELEKVIDIVDNIEDKQLKTDIINQILKCDRCLTNLAETIIKELINNTRKLEEK